MHGAAAADFPPLPASPSRSERSDDSMTGAAGHAAAAVATADDDGHLSCVNHQVSRSALTRTHPCNTDTV